MEKVTPDRSQDRASAAAGLLKDHAEAQALSGQIERLKSTKRDLEFGIAELQRKHDSTYVRLFASEAEQCQKLQEASRAYEQAVKDRDCVHNEAASLQDAIQHLRGERQYLKEQISESRVMLEQLQSAIEEAREQSQWIQTVHEKHRELREELATAMSELDGVKAQKLSLEKLIEQEGEAARQRFELAKRQLAEVAVVAEENRLMKQQITADEKLTNDAWARLATREQELVEREKAVEAGRFVVDQEVKLQRGREAQLDQHEANLKKAAVEVASRVEELISKDQALEAKVVEFGAFVNVVTNRDRQLLEKIEELEKREAKLAAAEAEDDDRLMKLRESAEELYRREQAIKQREKNLA